MARSVLGLKAPFDERVVLHTCHRVELLGVVDAAAVRPQPTGMALSVGAEAAERAFLVTGGLDSAVLAEEQILGQVKASYEAALAAGETGPVLNELLRRAIRFGKRVRSEAQPRNDRSLAERAVRWVAERLGPDGSRSSGLVLGSGAMGRLLARELAGRGMVVTVASRSLTRADAVIAELPDPGRHRSLLLEKALSEAPAHDVVAVAVRSASAPLERGHFHASRLPLVVDLSAPRAVTPEAAGLLGDRLLDLDGLGALSSSASLAPTAERRLRAAAEEEARAFIRWWSARPNGDGIALLRDHANAIRERHLERLRRRADLSSEQMAVVEAATAAMLGELLHVPTLRLRRDPDAREAVSRIFGIGP